MSTSWRLRFWIETQNEKEAAVLKDEKNSNRSGIKFQLHLKL